MNLLMRIGRYLTTTYECSVNATKHPPSPPRTNSSTRSNRRRKPAADLLAELHRQRDHLAARFNYDDARLIEHIDSLPLPPGTRVIKPDARTKP